MKLFANRHILPEKKEYISLLYPFWGMIPEIQGSSDQGRFDDYAAQGRNIFTIVESLADADAVVLPFEWRSRKQWGENYERNLQAASDLAAEASRFGKKLIIFFNNDSEEPVPVENSIVFRTSFSRSCRQANEFAMPGWSVDFLVRYLGGELIVRPKQSIPVVGYCGYVDYDFSLPQSLLMYGLRRLGGRKIKAGAALRGRAVRGLRKEKRLKLDYIYRADFKGGCGERERVEYVQNMTGCDYALVTRGVGNFSYRLYEVMSCGRIPVFVDTDCVLPFDHLIDWKKYCIWVDAAEIEALGEKIVAFHERITPDEFEGLQQSIRKLYEEWLSPTGFYRSIWRCFSACAEVKAWS